MARLPLLLVAGRVQASAVVDGFEESLIDSPIGRLRIRTRNQHLCAIDFLGGPKIAAETSSQNGECSAVCQAIRRYFVRPQDFTGLALWSTGTDFQQSVWQALREIPLGQVVTYGELAAQLGSSPRAVGNACRRNPVPLVVPCHRVVARNGLGGFAGATAGVRLAIKRWLLRHEGVEIPVR